MIKRLKVAVIQMNSSGSKNENVNTAVKLCQKAEKAGAKFILLPETFNCKVPKKVFSMAECIPGSSIRPLMDIAKDNRVWILAGSIYEKAKGKKVYNSSVLIDDRGKIKAVYRKMHLFKVFLNGRSISESKIYLKGKQSVLTSISGIKTGLSICYDLRFPELYRRYSKAGAQIICVPSSFTYITGRAHWEVLLRARAIENQCFVIAPNQCGTVNNSIRAYGNSMVVDPWGKVIARAAQNRQEIIYAELDMEIPFKIRRKLPALKHRTI